MRHILQVLALAVPLAGCGGVGLIYTDITTPLDTDFDNDPVVDRYGGSASGDVKTVQYYAQIDWDSNAIGDIMTRTGLEEVYYADVRTVSVLGLWKQRYITVYGRHRDAEKPEIE